MAEVIAVIHLTIMAMGKIFPLLRAVKGLSDQFFRFPVEFSTATDE